MKTRIAPTPSGFLHLGNLLSFAQTWIMTRRAGGELLLRIDDGDAARKRPEYIEDIFETLEYVGIDWDEGPSGPADFEKRWSQRHRQNLYQTVLDKIGESSDIGYACTCSRKEYSENTCTCRSKNLPLNDPELVCNWRLATNPTDEVDILDFSGVGQVIFPAIELGDFVVRKKDGQAAYQLSSLLDDLYFKIDHIVRGADLLPSTGAQLLLAHKLSPIYPPFKSFKNTHFFHHDLLLDPAGNKLSKSAGAAATGGWIKNSGAKKQFLELLAQTIGWESETPDNAKGFIY